MADRVLEHAMAKKGLGVPAAESKNILNQLAEQDAEIADKLKKINRQKKDEKAAAWESGSVKQEGRSSVGNTLNGIGEYFLYGVGKGVQNITLDNVNAQKLQALQRTTMIYEDIAQKESEKYGSVSERTASALLKARAEEQQELNEQQKFYSAPDDYSVLAEKYPASGAKQGVYDASSALGSLGVSMLAGAAGKGMGANAPSLGKVPAMTPAIVAQARGGAYGQAIAEGAQAEEARAYANMSGAKEGATEAMFGFAGPLSKIAGKGILNKPAGQALGKVLGKAAEELPNNTLRNVILNTAKGAAGEGAEEALSGAIDPYLQRATYNPEAENATAEELAYQVAIGAALGGILGGSSNVLDYRVNKGAKKAAQGAEMGVQQAQEQNTINNPTAENNGFKGKTEPPISPNNAPIQEQETYTTPQTDIQNDSQADNIYAEAYEEMVTGKGAAAQQALTEDEKNVKRFIQSAAVNARLEVKYDDLPTSRRAYYADGVLHINKNKLNEGMKVTAAHEIYHALEGTKEHDAVVELAIKAQGGDAQELIAQKIAEYANAGITLDEAGARAEIGAAFIEKAMSDEATINQVLLENRTLAQRILQWIKDMLSVFEKRKTMSAADLTEYKALLKARKQYEQGLAKLREGKYEPAGVERRAIERGQTETPEFKAWFGNSKVVDEKGKPKVVYSGHGNTNLFGSKFDIKKATSGGFYFTENPDIASSYAKDKLGNMETYANGDEYRFKNAKGDYKDTIDKVRLSDEQAAKFDEWLMDDMGYTWDDYLRENAPYEPLLRGLRNNGGKYNLQNIYTLMESLGYADNGWNYSTNSQGKSTFEELLDEMGIAWDSYTKQAGGVFPVYLDIRNPIDTSKPFPQDLLNELEYAARNERRKDAEGTQWTKDYPLREWVEDIKRGADGWATQVPTKARKIMLEMGYDGIKDTGGKMGGAEHTVWVAFEPTQIKSAIGNRGTFDPTKKDIRYSLDTDSRYNDLTDQYGTMDKGMEPRVDVDVPKQTNDFDKTRRFTRTAMESENVSDEAKEAIADDLAGDIASGRFTYEPTSNEKLQEKANASIARNGYEGAKQGIFKKYRDNEAFKAEDVALLEQLIVKASAEGRTQDAVDMIGLAAMVGTEMGQSVQALSMLKRMTPEGRLKQMEFLRDRLNTKYGLTGEKQINVNERYKRMLLNKDNTAEDIEKVQSYIIDDMAKQLPVSTKDKFDAWRYLAMLGNPRTHIRNTVGNAMNLTISRLNDQLAGIVEANLLKEGQRTRAAGRVSRELKEFARQDWETNGRRRTDMSNKYGERGQAERNKQVFKTKGLESLRKFNENALDAEDTLFKKKQYTYALSHYMKANNITPAEMEQGGVRAEAARKFAEDEAYKVTFQEYNALANALNRFENKKTDSKLEKSGQIAVKALMPFKRTPLNILKRGVEYSPVGLANGLSDMYKLLRKGDGNATAVITEITQGMTGSAIVVLGYFLAEMGVLTAGYDEENKRRQNYENQLGGQNYAITLPGGGTYTLDWAAPAVMPLFVGAAVYDDIVSRTDDDGAKSGLLQSVLHGLVKVTDPVLEMSCMDSLQSALESYGNEGATSNMIVSAAKSYLMQFVPTLSGQVARTIDETKRSTYAPSDSPYTKTGESLGRQFMNKVPGLSYSSEPALDVWGREREQAGGNIVGRAALNMLSPGTYAPNKETMADKEIKRLYDALGEDKVIPKTAAKYVTKKIDGKNRTFYLTAKEYTAFQKKYGQANFTDVSTLMRSSVYKAMSDADKAAAIAEIYDYNNKTAKAKFFKGRKVAYDGAESMTEKLNAAGGWVGYFATKQAFSEYNAERKARGDGALDYDDIASYKETCDRYGISYTAYSDSMDKIAALKAANSDRYTGSDKTEANKRDIARYLAGRTDLTDPQRQVLWQEIGNYKDTYKQTARRYGL